MTLPGNLAIAWAVLAGFNVLLRPLFFWRVFTGKAGPGARSEYMYAARSYGGIRNYVIASTAAGVVLAPLGFLGLCIGMTRAYQARQPRSEPEDGGKK